MGQLIDSKILSLQLGPPPDVSARPTAIHDALGEPGGMQGAPSVWKRPRPGMLPLIPARPGTPGCGDSYHPCPCVPLYPDPWHAGVGQWVEAGVGNCVNLGGFDAKAATAAKSLQSCPTLCDPIDGSPPGFPSLGFSRQERWSGLPFPSPMHESEK